MWSLDEDAALRLAAMEWLAARTHDGEQPLTTSEIEEFRFRGEPFRLRDRQRGIRKPKELASALSITTVWRPEGAARPYEDDLGSDGLIRYKWRGDDAGHADNRALRAAMHAEQPLIWFWGIGQAVYKPVFPIYLVAEETTSQQFVIALDGMQHLRPSDSPVEEVLRRYLRTETTRRLHQPVFRSMVMRAYENHCAVCALRHPVLLDAAHIVEDKHELGAASLRNGLALCKIHHAAYDAGILGVTPSYRVQIRADILEEVDGPLLEHGLKGLHGDALRFLPRSRREQPDPDLLQLHYDKFLAG